MNHLVIEGLAGLNVKNEDLSSLERWASIYFKAMVLGSPEKTIIAKKNDLSKFISFFKTSLEHDSVDYWTPSVTKQFQKTLLNHQGQYKATTINRIMATIRHFGRWLHKQRPLLAGNPLESVKDIAIDDPDWNGLTDIQIMRLKSACEQRANMCKRKNQNPLMEMAIFFVLLNTGLRESELVSLNIEDYHSRGFHNVKRKGNNITRKVPVPVDAKEYLDKYLSLRSPLTSSPTEPLFLSRYNNRLSTHDVIRICNRLSSQACVNLPLDKRFKLNPHMLRHTFLKRIADKHGLHVAQKMSGNVSISEIFRYTKPSQDEIDNHAENLF